jgi:hypothetical protein
MKPKKSSKNGAAPKKRMPKWKRRLDEYRAEELAKVTFAREDDINEALGIVWGGKLDGMAFNLCGDAMSLIMPKAGVPYFSAAGLQFNQKKLSSNNGAA